MVFKFSREKKKNDFPGKWEERKSRGSGLRNRGIVVGMGNESCSPNSINTSETNTTVTVPSATLAQ